MEKIFTQAKMSKIDLDTMFFEIILSMKGDCFRARSSSLAQIANIKEIRPEATSKVSYENAIQKLIPKIENSLSETNKCLGRVFQNDVGKTMYSVENIIYQNKNISLLNNNTLNCFNNDFMSLLKNFFLMLQNTNVQQTSLSTQSLETQTGIKILKFTDICVEWLQYLLERTKKDYNDEDYLSPKSLESYNNHLRDYVFPYLEKHPEYDNINVLSETHVDEILNTINAKDTKRILLVALKLVFEFAKEKSYITENPIANKKQKRKKRQKKEYDFIEEEQRTLWINCMIKEFHSSTFAYTDSALAFLCTLLHGNRPEETCGTKWIDFDLEENDYHIQNAYKNIPIYDKKTMKRIGWQKGDSSLKTPESNRHLSLDLIFKQLLIEHKEKQIEQYKKENKKWSENEYVFLNKTGTPFTSDVLSRNFRRFIERNKLPKMVIYGLRHSFATHCRNLGVKSEVLARLMGHTEYETTQRYYIHISSKQKREALQKVQQQDIENYLYEEKIAI